MRLHRLSIVATAGLSAACAFGQVREPDQGPQEMTPPRMRSGVPLAIQPDAPAAPADPQAAKVQVILASVRVEGSTRLNAGALARSLGDVAGQSFDLAGLRALAAQVQAQVREAGYSFARAYVPAQNLAGGILRIVVVEGQYGQVQATGPAAEPAQRYLATLKPGEPIQQAPLERALLLLQQLPGVQVQASLGPGNGPGDGDLQVQAEARRETRAEVGIDNHGSNSSGQERVHARVEVASPFGFGDKLSLSAHYSRLGTWQGSAAYSLPVGTDGLRANFSASRSDYQLGEEFESLEAHGTSDTLSASLSYPLVLKLGTSVTVSAGVQRRHLRDQFDAMGVDQKKRTQSLPVTLSADHRDARGVSWGNLTLTMGRLRLDGAMQAQDETTAQSAGRFSKLNLDAARLHDVAKGWTLYARVSGQWASKNLDASEKFALGGPFGVRAWPVGEALGDEGWLGQLELRYRLDVVEPYAFIDAGGVRINHAPWTDGDNRRSLSGAGIGMRWTLKDWVMESSVAWRGSNTPPASDPDAGSPQLWVSLGRRF